MFYFRKAIDNLFQQPLSYLPMYPRLSDIVLACNDLNNQIESCEMARELTSIVRSSDTRTSASTC